MILSILVSLRPDHALKPVLYALFRAEGPHQGIFIGIALVVMRPPRYFLKAERSGEAGRRRVCGRNCESQQGEQRRTKDRETIHWKKPRCGMMERCHLQCLWGGISTVWCFAQDNHQPPPGRTPSMASADHRTRQFVVWPVIPLPGPSSSPRVRERVG